MPELMQLMEDWKGYTSLSDINRGEGYGQKLTEVINLLSNAQGLPAHRHEYLIREALTTSDFPYLFGDVLDRQVLASYKAVDPVWKAIVKMSTVPDFREARRFWITGGDQHLDRVTEKGEYLASERNEDYHSLYVYKYGRQFDISWEAMINDEMNALKDTPERFARAAVRTEHRIATGLYAGDFGVNHTANLYASAVAGEVNADNNVLTIANLEAALGAMAVFTDAGGEMIQNRAKYLVVPPALEMTAKAILTSTTMMRADAGAPAPYPTSNVVSQMGLQLIVDPYLPILDTTQGSVAWYLFANPQDVAAIEFAHLRGHERPEICMKASDKVTVGGGAIGPMSGDFATDNVFYRVRLCAGVTRLDWRATYAGGITAAA